MNFPLLDSINAGTSQNLDNVFNQPSPYNYPSLTPMYGLGSYGRTGAATVISSPRTKIGSQGRIYAYWKSRGLGQQYEMYLIDALGIKFLPQVNPQSYM